MLDRWTIIYISVVGGVGLTLASVLRFLFARAERVRSEGVEQLRRFVAVKPSSQDREGPKKARARALESIATRFAMIRRLTIPFVLLVTGLMVAAPFFGRIPAALVTLLITGATIVIGIAAKPVLENVIAGIMVSFSQPIRIGDLVSIDGHYAVVEQINLTYTVFKIWDFRRFVVPNTKLLQSDYINYTLNDKWLWASVKFSVAYDADMKLVEELALRAVRESPHSTDDAPGFWIIEMKRDGVECWLAGWVEHPLEAWGLRHDVAARLIHAFQAHGIRAHVFQHESREPRPPVPLVPQDPADPGQ